MAHSARHVYRLADLTIDVGTAEVRRDGHLIPLPRLSFDVLVVLIEAAPNLVTVDDLMESVWPGIVVNAETVTQRIKLLRTALDEDTRHPRYIALSRGRGYRVAAPVTKVEIAGPNPGAADPPPTPRPARARWAGGALSAIALVALAGFFFVERDRSQASTAPVSLPDRAVAVLQFDNLGQSPQDAALAFGVAETLLHRLSASKDLTVIARQSSFSFAPRGADVREIGRKLNARYLVEGSLQSSPTRLRITAQLIDAATGGHVWSLQFDRKPEDIFIIQDEIAARVADALRLTMAGSLPGPGAGTKDFDAYLAHAQGRAHLATDRVADAKLAIADFERAIRIDPRFARAYAGLAEAHIAVADGEMSRERARNLSKAQSASRQLLEQALRIDERDADAHLQLAELYWEGEQAEKELARALELNPNSAAGYRLMAFMRRYRDRLPDEGIAAIDKARLLSPLEVRYDNDKARLALYGKSDVALAEQLSLSVLERDPSSTAALWRLGEIYWCCRAQQARGIKYLEQALERDPDHEFGRRVIIRAYLDLNDAAEAQAIAASAPHPVDARLVPILAYGHEWRAAAERSYEESELGTSQGIEADLRIMALRIHARQTGEYERARKYLARWSNVSWDGDGVPTAQTEWSAVYSVGLADVLMQMGERERAIRLLDVVFKAMEDEGIRRHRGYLWYLRPLSIAYAVLGRNDDALDMLEKSIEAGHLPAFVFYLENEPAFERLRTLPRFQAILARARRLAAAQRRELDEMRASGLVPYRSKPPA